MAFCKNLLIIILCIWVLILTNLIISIWDDPNTTKQCIYSLKKINNESSILNVNCNEFYIIKDMNYGEIWKEYSSTSMVRDETLRKYKDLL